MLFRIRGKQPRPVLSPVLVLDALGLSARVDQCQDLESLANLALELDGQFHGFRSKVPHRAMFVGRKRVIGTHEFSPIRLNDMFILYSERQRDDLLSRYLVASSIIYHQLLNTGFIVRGGLGFGPVVQHRGLFLGRGFLDAYRMSEKRSETVRNICGVLVSPSFFIHMPWSEKYHRLLCLFEDHYFLNPHALTDPDLGEFDRDRILRCLRDAGTDEPKMTATKRFLERFEDYEAAMLPNSRSRQLTGWNPAEGRLEPEPKIEVDDPMMFDDWGSVWQELSRVRGTVYSPSANNKQ